ncbi:MAG: ribonuclease [Frankiales bacterium]|nr:ribonuclease [Frankiales bacterium]
MTAPAARPRRRTPSSRPATRAPRPPAAAPTGVFRPHVRGFGFVDLDEPVTTPDGTTVSSCFVPPPMTKGLLADDRVEVAYEVEQDGRATASAATLVERVRTEVFGVVEEGLVLRLDPHLGSGRWTLTGRIEDLPVGAAVLADITGPSTADPSDEWDDPVAADALLERVRVRHRLPTGYPPEVLAEVAAVADGKARRSATRRDLRTLTTFTIDSPSSRDLDDALSVYPADADGGIRVCVHIADVAAHVRPGTAIDAEARRAATSVYLPGWTRPMLPAQLSEDALSLVPDADRDALTVEMRIATDGSVTAADVYATRIRSNTRLSYEAAAEALAGHAPAEVPPDVLDALRWLRTAGARLGVQRLRRGGVEARRVEPELTVEVVEGEAAMVAAYASNPANLLIERLMVAANEAVAGWLVDRGLPGIFRVHPAPGPEAAPALEAFCAASGFHPGFGATLTPLDLAALSAQLDAAADDTATAVWDVLLGFLGRASYVPTAGDHFGLASAGYLHFTSPIRRYADLAVHRVIHAFLAGGRDVASFPDAAETAALCRHINAAARTASQAENQMRKSLWMAQLAAAARDTVYPARVTGVGPKGVFVTLDRSRVSGMVSTRELPGHGWSMTPDGLGFSSASGGRLGYGDTVSVRITSADVESGQLELAIAKAAGDEAKGETAPRARTPRKRAPRKAAPSA